MEVISSPPSMMSISEEATMDPLSPFPSFLEMILCESTSISGRKALLTSLDAVVSRLHTLSRSTYDSDGNDNRKSWKWKMYRFSYGIGKKYGPELRLVLVYLLQRKSLFSKACATLSESVYAMTRSKVERPNPNGSAAGRKLSPLSEIDKVRSAILESFIPYLKERSDRIYERMKDGAILRERSIGNDNRQLSGRERLQKLFLILYPFLHLSYEGTILAYQWAYLLGKTIYFSPSLHFLGIIVRRVTFEDLNQHQTLSPPPPKYFLSGKKLEQYIKMIRIGIITGVSAVIVSGWVIQLRNMLQRRRRARIAMTDNFSSGDVLSIPPPAPLKPIRPDVSNRTFCACTICHQIPVNPTASTSGYVFCYRCIILHVRESGTCPVTMAPCTESRLVRLYETNN